MKKSWFVFYTFISISSVSLLAQKNPPQTINIGVWDFDVQELSPSNAQALSNLVRVELVKLGKFTIVDRGNMQKILSEQGFQQTGCTSQECVVEVGKLLGVQKMVSGNISKLGQLFIINLQLTDIATGKIEKLEQEQFSGMIEQLTEPMSRLTRKLMGEAVIEVKETAFYISSNPQGANVFMNDRTAGNAPVKIPVSPGNYRIKVTAKGYSDWTQVVTARANETVIIDPHLVELKGVDAMGIDFNALAKEAGRKEAKVAISKLDSLHKKLLSATKMVYYSGFISTTGGILIVITDFKKNITLGLTMLLGGALFTIVGEANQSSIQKKIDKLKSDYNIPLSLEANQKKVLLTYQFKF